MTDIFTTIMIFMILVAIAAIMLFIWFVLVPKVDSIGNIEVPNDTQNVINEFRSIIHSPTKKGHLGEYIVRMSLERLPKGMVTEKLNIPQIQGIPDFAVKIDELYLIIDSKFTTTDDAPFLVKRGVDISKYITPGFTFPFVLMWIPEPAWEVLRDIDVQKLIDKGVIPCTTPGLVSTVYLVNYMYKFFEIGDKYNDVQVWFNRMDNLKLKNDDALTDLTRAMVQVTNGLSNLKKTEDKMKNIDFKY